MKRNASLVRYQNEFLFTLLRKKEKTPYKLSGDFLDYKYRNFFDILAVISAQRNSFLTEVSIVFLSILIIRKK